MVRIEFEPFGFGCPDFADVFVWRESTERFEAAPVVVCVDEVAEVGGQLGMAVVMIAFDRRFLMVRFIRSTWPLAHGCFTLVRRCSIPFSSQTRSKRPPYQAITACGMG